MSLQIAIIDYGLGNLFSIYKAFAYQEISAQLIDRPDALAEADAILLPGVGAFKDGMIGLTERGFVDPIKKFAASGKPVMGICLGMQMLMDESFEMGQHRGLGLIAGQVVPFESTPTHPIKIPQIGWNKIHKNPALNDPLLATTPEGSMYYFVHSYFVRPQNAQHVLAETEYGSTRFCSIVKKDNIYGCQFHPEKSAMAGLELLKSFAGLAKEGGL